MRLSCLLTAILVPIVTTSAVAGQEHPHFDDGGALQWQTQYAAAKAVARTANKLIFIEYGRGT